MAPQSKVIIKLQVLDLHQPESVPYRDYPKDFDLDTSIDTLIIRLEGFFKDLAEWKKTTLIQLETHSSGRHGLYMRASLTLGVDDNLPIRNVLVHEDRYGPSRFQTIKDLLTTAELEKAKRDGPHPTLPLTVSFEAVPLRLSADGGTSDIGSEYGKAPKLLAQVVENDLSFQSLEGRLKFTSAHEERFRMQHSRSSGNQHPYVRITDLDSADLVVEFHFDAQRSSLVNYVLAMAEAGETSATGEPMMTFNSFERSRDLPHCCEIGQMYLVVRPVNKLATLNLGDAMLPSSILLRIDQSEMGTTDRVKQGIMAVLEQHLAIPASGANVTTVGSTGHIMATQALPKWKIQLWVMPQVDPVERKLFLHEKQSWNEYLNPAWMGNDGVACLYVEAHLIPRADI